MAPLVDPARSRIRRVFGRMNNWIYPSRQRPEESPSAPNLKHLGVLDGWRGISIVMVLAAHLVPAGRIANTSFGLMGMSLFFTLSGFLITSFLLKDGATVTDFLIRRLFRIVPLAWLYLSIVLFLQHEPLETWLANLLFYGNIPDKHIRLATDHLWSLDVEMQFYAGIAAIFALFGKRGLVLLPLFALLVTGARISYEQYGSSVTWFRIDEILAGCTLALVFRGKLGRAGELILQFMRSASPWYFLVLLLLSSLWGLDHGRWFTYLRPYCGMLAIGATLLAKQSSMTRLLDNRPLQYLAGISFALYVLHIGLVYTWLGSGDGFERYAKRPLLFIVLFLLAHLSTFYFEHPMILLGKRISARLSPRLANAQIPV